MCREGQEEQIDIGMNISNSVKICDEFSFIIMVETIVLLHLGIIGEFSNSIECQISLNRYVLIDKDQAVWQVKLSQV